MISALASAGVFVAIPITGSLALGRGPVDEGRAGRIPLVFAVGLTLWSVPLLGLLVMRAYRPEFLGALGWLVVVAWVVLRRPRLRPIRRPRPHVLVLGIGLALAGVLYAAAPYEAIAGGRDMAVYANHAMYMAHHGRLDIPYPAGLGTGQSLPDGWVSFSGVYTTHPTLTVAFGHIFPAWLAQAFGVAGYGALLHLNPVIGVISSLAVFAVARRWMPGHVAVLAALFLAFSAGQVWVARNTLTETLTQLLVWAAFLMLVSERQERPRASAAWAGVLLGMSALVRIDSLVVLPLVIAGHTLVRLVGGRAAEELRMSSFYLTAVPSFALGVGYYVAYSNPYFMAHSRLILPIVGASLLAGAVSGLSRVPGVWNRASRVVTSAPFLGVAAAAVVLLAGFAYFVRPIVEPFALQPPNPLQPDVLPPRSYIEEAMSNLGLYLSPPVLWVAVLAWLGMTVTAILRRTLRPLPVFVIIGGFSALYFWNQSITPDHFWALRRFVPIILPAAILFAGVAGAVILVQLPQRWRSVAFAIAAVALALQTWRVGWPMFFVAERAGIYAALEGFANELPRGVTYLGPLDRKGMQTYGTALFLAFDHDILPIAFDEEVGREEIIARFRAASPEQPIPLIMRSSDPVALSGEVIAEVHHNFSLMTPTFQPVPQAVMEGDFRQGNLGLTARWVTGVSTLDFEMGPQSHWLVEQAGFFPAEPAGDHMARWTDGRATVTVPIFQAAYPERLLVELDWTGPTGASLAIIYNGTQLFSGGLQSGPWAGTFELPVDAATEDDQATIELRSSTFVPAEQMAGSQDPRRLGVLVRSLRLLGSGS